MNQTLREAGMTSRGASHSGTPPSPAILLTSTQVLEFSRMRSIIGKPALRAMWALIETAAAQGRTHGLMVPDETLKRWWLSRKSFRRGVYELAKTSCVRLRERPGLPASVSLHVRSIAEVNPDTRLVHCAGELLRILQTRREQDDLLRGPDADAARRPWLKPDELDVALLELEMALAAKEGSTKR